jgi:hypothetical protein
MAFTKTISKNAIGAIAGTMIKSRRDMIYKKDGLFTLNIFDCADGMVTRTTYMDTTKRAENRAFWDSADGVALNDKLKNVLTIESREVVESLPPVTDYFFFNLSYDIIDKVPTIMSMLTDIEGLTVVEYWDQDNFKLGCNPDKKELVEKVLNTMKIPFTV